MIGRHKSFHQIALVIVVIIAYSSFSDSIYTFKNVPDNNNMPHSPYVFYYHLPSIPIEEDYSGMLQKIPYRLALYRQSTVAGILHGFLVQTVSLLVFFFLLLLKRFGKDKPKLNFLLPLRGHGPPIDRLILSLS